VRNTTANCFGFHTLVCAECQSFVTYNVGSQRPETCSHCGKPLRDVSER
jgi:hypothetical protein